MQTCSFILRSQWIQTASFCVHSENTQLHSAYSATAQSFFPDFLWIHTVEIGLNISLISCVGQRPSISFFVFEEGLPYSLVPKAHSFIRKGTQKILTKFFFNSFLYPLKEHFFRKKFSMYVNKWIQEQVGKSS